MSQPRVQFSIAPSPWARPPPNPFPPPPHTKMSRALPLLYCFIHGTSSHGSTTPLPPCRGRRSASCWIAWTTRAAALTRRESSWRSCTWRPWLRSSVLPSTTDWQTACSALSKARDYGTQCVLWIPDKSGSVPLTYGSGTGSWFFGLWLTRCQQKIIFLLFTFWRGTFTLVCIDKKSKKSHNKVVEIKVILTSFACWWKDPDQYKVITDPDPGGPKTYGFYGSGSTTLELSK